MIIDSHVHISIFNKNANDLKGAFLALLNDMDLNKINYSIVIPDNIKNLTNIADLEKASDLIKGNKRFFLLASPQIINRDANELENYKKLMKKGAIKGIKLFPGHDPYYPIDERCFPYYQLCQKYDYPVLFHTGINSNDNKCSKYNDPKYLVQISKRYPRLKIGIAHFYWPKLDYCYEVTKNNPNIYFDILSLADKEVIKKSGGIEKVVSILKKTVNNRSDKVVFGTNWPMCKIKDHIDIIESLKLKSDIRKKIFYKNSINLYRLQVKL